MPSPLGSDHTQQTGNPWRIEERTLHGEALDEIVHAALFHESPELRQRLHTLIRALASRQGICPASTTGLYARIAQGQTRPFTMPAIEVHALAYESARACFRAAIERNAGAFLIRLSESGWEEQEFASLVLAAAMQEGYQGPVFLQAGHVRIDAGQYRSEREAETTRLKQRLVGAVKAGLWDLEIDASGLRQGENYSAVAELVSYARSVQPREVVLGLGAAPGLFDRESAVDELRAFVEGFMVELGRRGRGVPGLAKIFLRLDQGSTSERSPADLGLLRELATTAQYEFGIGVGLCVPSGGLTTAVLECLADSRVTEVRLPSDIETGVLAGLDIPEELLPSTNEADFEPGETWFRFRGRKKLRALVERVWRLPAGRRESVTADVQSRLGGLMDCLGIGNTHALVSDCCAPPTRGRRKHKRAGATARDTLQRLKLRLQARD